LQSSQSVSASGSSATQSPGNATLSGQGYQPFSGFQGYNQFQGQPGGSSGAPPGSSQVIGQPSGNQVSSSGKIFYFLSIY